MALVDWVIVVVLVMAVAGGLQQGFFRAVFGLGGLFLGLLLAAWNYARLAVFFMPVVRYEPVADSIGFLVIAALVMAVAAIMGSFLAKAIRGIGLGCLDRIAGGVFGLLQGALIVMLCVLVTLAFFPQARWLSQARLPRQFFGACHVTTHMTPSELAQRIRLSLKRLEEKSPEWMHPGSVGS